MRQNFIDVKYSVIFDDYTARYYIRDFERKYKERWDVTRKSIEETLERIARLSGTNTIDVICPSNKDTFLVKFEFKVAKTDVSAKSSGNRCILEVCNNKMQVRVLLVYCKDHIERNGKETLWWMEHVSSGFGLSCS